MASTFTTNYGFEEIATGEQSGTWGTTTNFNYDILDRIASFAAVALSGSTHTLTVREASPGQGTENLQDGMHRVIKFTGALGANNTVTVAPNTTKAFFIFTNSTTDSGSSGPYSVIISQGSGANITIANGKSAIVYCDGAGSGAAVVDAISNLALATLTTSGAITSGGTVAVTGNVTATGTVEPAGDTAAGDDAAIGYTSAEGLILTGQGSTNDVTIKNDADADVITIATGATNVDIVGDVTASTVNADGDTAASDKAAMGYTAAEGLILTGQGSTNDVTIKNDADAAVIKIAPGGTGVEIVGALTLGTDLSVANGGTGASTLTANSVLLGNGTSAPQMIAPSTSGNVLTSDGSTWASVAGGKVLQVVTGTTTTQVDTSSTTLVDTGLSAAITPSATSSKVLCLVSQSVSHNGRSVGRLVLLRTTTNIYDTIEVGDADNQRTLHFAAFLDSPSTTSATTYKTQMARFAQSGTINIQRNDSGSAGKSTIILAEIGA